MKVGVIVNPKAGRVDVDLIIDKIDKALFRCRTQFFKEPNIDGLRSFLSDQVQNEVDYLVLVGGDGTLNLVANLLMEIKATSQQKLPPLCLVSSGTANDLAFELGVNMRIEKAVHAIYSGNTQWIDLIKISSDNKDSYMITNGGVGLTAEVAKSVNDIREYIRDISNGKSDLEKTMGWIGSKIVKYLGPNIYNLMLVGRWATWSPQWKISVTYDNGKSVETSSPFVLVNNQKTLARRFYTAPATNNTDGKFNVLIFDHKKKWNMIKNVVGLGMGKWTSSPDVLSKEVKKLTIKSLSSTPNLHFFGDGEVLQQKVKELNISCIHPGLEIISDRNLQS